MNNQSDKPDNLYPIQDNQNNPTPNEYEIEIIKDENVVINTTLTFDTNLDRLKEYPIWTLKSDKGEFVSRTPITEGVRQYLLINGISITKSKEFRISSVGTIGGVNVTFKSDNTIEYKSSSSRDARKKVNEIKKELGNKIKITYYKCETISISEEKEKCKKVLGIEEAWEKFNT